MDSFRRVIDLTKTVKASEWTADVKNALARLSEDPGLSDSRRAEIRTQLEAITASETVEASDARKTIEVLKVGHWSTPNHGEFDVTTDNISNYAANYGQDVRPHSSQHGLPIDEEHSKGAAKAWLKNVRASDDGQTLLGDVEYTPEGQSLVENGTYKFFSPEFSPQYMDPEGKLPPLKDVLMGGAFTNRPLFKGLQSVSASDGTSDDKNEILISASEEEKKDVTLADLRGKARADVDDEGMKILTAAKDQLNDEERNKFFPPASTTEADDKSKQEQEAAAAAAKAKEEADKKVADEAAAEKAKKDADAIAASEAAKTGKEQNVTISASDLAALRSNAQMGVEAKNELDAKKASDHVDSLAFSEKSGFKVPTDMKGELDSFYISASENDKKLMDKVLTNANPLLADDGMKEVGQTGHNGNIDPTEELDKKAQEILANDKTGELKGRYDAALRQAMNENPDLAKEVDQSEASKMPQVAA